MNLLPEDSPVRVGSGEHPEGSAKEAHPLVDAQASQSKSCIRFSMQGSSCVEASVLACWAADFPWRAVQGQGRSLLQNLHVASFVLSALSGLT